MKTLATFISENKKEVKRLMDVANKTTDPWLKSVYIKGMMGQQKKIDVKNIKKAK